ncbi:DUF6600 domain-containing protein [Persicitalea jodogahamensis]|uniref:Prolin-rich transmembrane protein n=1 Tax=Persicitalea jodogahamensis TaxID=402147 RepID=A0A8J3D5B3_9BACT|nr:DUF6600 domain-containing protein [Persicitalea jodogahamensis]GHB55127.1 hypothetical protein GCM10007390_05360 [Persicitalea jodogahamensis]
MKNSKTFLLLAFLTLGLLGTQKAQAQRGGAVNFQYFYNELSPYGSWSSDPRYGSVWTPYDVGRNFQPYGTDGRWVMTEFGNTWVSDFSWGWATFHYGRWFYDDYRGWAWVPGYEWGPAWVDWRSNNDYYGWAPMWPGVRVGVSFNIPLNYWVFIPRRHLFNRNVFGYCVPRYRYNSFFGRTTVINNYYYNDNRNYQYSYGPSRGEVERVTRGTIPTYRAEEIRGNRYASNNGSGTSNRTYRADDTSRSGLDRQSRDNSGSINGRTYDAGTSSRSSRSYGSNENSSNGRSSYESTAPSSSRTYDANESSSRSRSGSAYESSSRSSATPSYDSGNSSRSSSPSVSSPPSYESRSRSSAPQTRSAPSVRSAPSQPSSSSRSRSNSSYSAPSRSSSRSTPAPSMSSRSSSQSSAARTSAPSSSSRSSSSSSSSRSRGPR